MKQLPKPLLKIQEIQALRSEYRMAEVRLKNMGLKKRVMPWKKYLRLMQDMKKTDPKSFQKIITGEFRNHLN